MKVFNYKYENEYSLNTFIDDNIDKTSCSLLIQVFSGILNESIVKNILESLSKKLPNAYIIGTSTSGEVVNGEMQEESMILSFSSFKNVDIKLFYTPDVNFKSGQLMAKKTINNNTKAVICFSESLKSDPQNFFKGFESINNKVIIAGGNAGDNGKFQKTFVIKDSVIYDKGMVLCTLNSDTLLVNNNYTLNWTPIGKEMLITKASDNIVYEINDKPILEVYMYYFGENIVEDMPASIVEFPLLKHENKTDIARSLVVLNEDKSFVFAGHFKVGDKVRFAVGNINEVLKNAKKFSKEVSEKPSEGIFIYSCMVRKMFLDKQLNTEFSLLNEIGPTSGFFTYGEFFNTGKSNQVLNISTTILSLSETNTKHIIKETHNESKTTSTLKSLTHLVNVTERELEEQIILLEKTQEQLIESEKMASLGTLVAGVAHEVNTPLGVALTGVSQIEYEGKKLSTAYKNSTLSESMLKEYFTVTRDLTRTINLSLGNAAKLITSFKHISVDQHLDESRLFNLREYVGDTILTLKNECKKKNVVVINNINKSIDIESYPGVFSQIFSNLILNSIKHGFENKSGNKIEIISKNENGLEIYYKDNGKGVPTTIQKKIFDPFYTTARGQGGSGLGLSIVYNLVTQKLQGEIKILSDSKEGLSFKISL